MEKTCSRCGKVKPIEEFVINNSNKDGRDYACKICKKAYGRDHYLRNKRLYKNRAIQRELFLKNFVNRVKSFSKCEICGESRWWVLEYHHKDPSTKNYSVSVMPTLGLALKTIKNEIKKCQILCANCHRDLHHNTRQNNAGIV